MKTANLKTREVTGAIVRYTTNKHNDIDGLVVDQEGALKDVKFPPHTARFIRDVAVEGDTVRLTLQDKPHPPHHGHNDPKPRLQLSSIEITSAHRQFSVGSVKPPHPPETGSLVTFTISKPQFTRGGKHDEITGVVFEDNYIHLHPEQYDQGVDALASASVVHIKAKKRSTEAGFVNAGGHTVYHAHVLTIGEK
jgi:hypothetical protein